ncbi:hypothetical protein C2845_PM07G14520 [Panicum miliaceum]|uniref:Uncharacterized protein n=1 Tax=Panicum miliaceum TaxID=4540 RepID=A0A3L6SL86_PANMI|nr:hypothetical protein C2845_PM07G14520 [Panicum miliaceum]
MEEEWERAGIPNPLAALPKRARWWVYARGDFPRCGQVIDKSQEAQEVVEKMLDMSSQTTQGTLKQDRERDVLTMALQNDKHPGRTRGMGSKVPWGKGFSEYSDSYRSQSRSKAHQAELTEERIIAMVDERVQQVLIQSSQCNINRASSPPARKSSCASTSHLELDASPFPVDEIQEATRCRLAHNGYINSSCRWPSFSK